MQPSIPLQQAPEASARPTGTPELYFDLNIDAYQAHLDRVGRDAALMLRVGQGAHDLMTKGYCVIPAVVERELCDYAHRRFWEVMDAASDGRMPRPASAADLAHFGVSKDWMLNKHGILEEPAFAHLDFVHAVRTHPAVATVFAALYGAPTGLIVAPDRINYQLPVEWLKRTAFDEAWAGPAGPDAIGRADEATWAHVDQNFAKAGLHCVQGLVVMVDADQPGDASLEVVARSHLLHADMPDAILQLAPARRPKRADDWFMFNAEEKALLAARGFFGDYQVVRARAGDLVLWDSRTTHQGGRIRAHATKLPRPVHRPRFVVYVCMQPAWEPLSVKQVQQKHKIFREGRATSHWPLRSKLFGAPQTYGRKIPFDFSTQVFKPLDARSGHCLYPVLGEFTGLAQLRVLRFPQHGAAPLLAFHPSSGMLDPRRVVAEKKRRLFNPNRAATPPTADEVEEPSEDRPVPKRARRSDVVVPSAPTPLPSVDEDAMEVDSREDDSSET